jgi:hypothetical protein
MLQQVVALDAANDGMWDMPISNMRKFLLQNYPAECLE